MRIPSRLAAKAKDRAEAKARADLMNCVARVVADGPQFEHRDGWSTTERAGSTQWAPHERRPIIGFAPR